ncbi:unnamed protein product, partial [Brassicogethes aeneus]
MCAENIAKNKRGTICCVVGCLSRGNPGLSFYRFPKKTWESERKKKWINSVRRITVKGKP